MLDAGKTDGAVSARGAVDGWPDVSFVVPCYNVASTLPQAIASLLAQTYDAIEIVAVDDASTDATLRELHAWAAADARVRVVEHPLNRGYGAAMNSGIAEARGTWIGILEPDDWVRPGMVSALLSAARGIEARVDVVKAPYLRVVERLGRAQFSQCAYRGRVEPTGTPFALGGEASAQLLRQHPSIWSALYCREFLDEAGIGFPEHPGSGWADNEFFYRSLLGAKCIVYVDEPFYCYREDTPEQLAQTVRAHPCLPLQRWLDLDDVVRELGVQDGALLQAHTTRAFDYLSSCIDAGVANQEDVAALRACVFARLDPARVAAEEAIAPELKRLFAVETGTHYDEATAQQLFSHYRRSEFAYMVRSNGASFAARHLARYLLKRG